MKSPGTCDLSSALWVKHSSTDTLVSSETTATTTMDTSRRNSGIPAYVLISRGFSGGSGGEDGGGSAPCALLAPPAGSERCSSSRRTCQKRACDEETRGGSCPVLKPPQQTSLSAALTDMDYFLNLLEFSLLLSCNSKCAARLSLSPPPPVYENPPPSVYSPAPRLSWPMPCALHVQSVAKSCDAWAIFMQAGVNIWDGVMSCCLHSNSSLPLQETSCVLVQNWPVQ